MIPRGILQTAKIQAILFQLPNLSNLEIHTDASSIRDDKWFKSYRVDREHSDWRDDELPSLVARKERRILMAVVRDDVHTLRELLNSPRWYRVIDRYGLSLLHISILEQNKDTFDFLLSLQDFPLELASDHGETPLICSILSIDEDKSGDRKTGNDYYVWRLIEAGADVFYRDHFGYTSVACAALKHHVKLAERLIQDGVDVNVQNVYGNTALHCAVDHDGPDCLEFVCLLLENGADAGISNNEELVAFESAIRLCPNTSLHQILFNYTYDECTEMKTKLSTLVKLAKDRSPLLTHFKEVEIDENYIQLFQLDLEYLNIFISRFRSAIAEILPMCALREWSRQVVTFDKMEAFINSDLKMELISCIRNEEDDLLFKHLIECDLDEATISSTICYFLSYGLNLTESGLQKIYQRFGYCDLLKILLHMDVEIEHDRKRHVMPSLLCDVNFSLDQYLEDAERFSTEDVDHLLRYFVSGRLNEICCDLYGEEIDSRIRNLPQVPSLVELARNTFRGYFIRTLKIENSRQFYTLIKNLNVLDVYKKIITFEKVLYKF